MSCKVSRALYKTMTKTSISSGCFGTGTKSPGTRNRLDVVRYWFHAGLEPDEVAQDGRVLPSSHKHPPVHDNKSRRTTLNVPETMNQSVDSFWCIKTYLFQSCSRACCILISYGSH